jgi:hypothetical protein
MIVGTLDFVQKLSERRTELRISKLGRSVGVRRELPSERC